MESRLFDGFLIEKGGDKMATFGTCLKTLLAAAIGAIVYWLGGLDQLLVTLLAVIVLDYCTGLLSGAHNRELSSKTGFAGIAKKVVLLGVVALSFIIQQVIGGAVPLREVTITFFVVNEGLSILENAAEMGLPIPQRLKELLQQLRIKGDKDV